MDENSIGEKVEENKIGIGVGIGMGISFGIVFWTIYGNVGMGNVGMGIMMGVVFGMIFGVGATVVYKEEKESEDQE